MLGQRRRRWPNNKTTLAQRLVFAGLIHKYAYVAPDYDVVSLCNNNNSNTHVIEYLQFDRTKRYAFNQASRLIKMAAVKCRAVATSLSIYSV